MLTGKELARAYFDGLKEAYLREGGQELWDHFTHTLLPSSSDCDSCHRL